MAFFHRSIGQAHHAKLKSVFHGYLYGYNKGIYTLHSGTESLYKAYSGNYGGLYLKPLMNNFHKYSEKFRI